MPGMEPATAARGGATEVSVDVDVDRAARWVHLSDFITTVSAARGERQALRTAIANIATVFDATFAGLIDDHGLVEAEGWPDAVRPETVLDVAVLRDEPIDIDVPVVGRCQALYATIAARPTASPSTAAGSVS